ncbi:hypothetical protein BpHYR1_054123 [Brachionus plicatilis]|uniref:Uncharacterized protein n=1 Tax=Brachionus plicatilis TaxID=10195 RepID=A0A3M7SMM1_BRAPC|nr:hypothetical protein BpHYR1_054123 [Brachionus plicatilis]
MGKFWLLFKNFSSTWLKWTKVFLSSQIKFSLRESLFISSTSLYSTLKLTELSDLMLSLGLFLVALSVFNWNASDFNLGLINISVRAKDFYFSDFDFNLAAKFTSLNVYDKILLIMIKA